jgi:AcrR family transcriptional regulator
MLERSAQPRAIPPAAGRMSAGRRREQILDVTAAIVTQRGFAAASMQSIATAAGVSRAVVYEHFGNLAALLETLVARETGRALEQATRTALPDLADGNPVTLMLDSLRRYLETVQQHASTWRLVLTAPEGAPELLRESIRNGRQQILSKLTSAVAPLDLAPETPFDPELTARILSALADEYARLLLADPDRYNAERLVAHARVIIEKLGDR